MQVIPVIDLLGGQVVRGIGGRRGEYQPIVSQIAADACPATVARALALRFGFDTVYVADLDAIMHGRLSVAAWHEIAAAGLKLWLDAGAGTPDAIECIELALAPTALAVELIVGLESVESIGQLATIGRRGGLRPTVFSLDLKGGQPLVRETCELLGSTPLSLVSVARQLEIEQVIVLDLADVGGGRGTGTLDLCREIRNRYSELTIVAGGGVRGLDDLKALADAGCDAALVASALHDGRLTRQDIERAADFGRQR